MLKCVMAITIACKTEKSVIESSIAPEKKLKKKTFHIFVPRLITLTFSPYTLI